MRKCVIPENICQRPGPLRVRFKLMRSCLGHLAHLLPQFLTSELPGLPTSGPHSPPTPLAPPGERGAQQPIWWLCADYAITGEVLPTALQYLGFSHGVVVNGSAQACQRRPAARPPDPSNTSRHCCWRAAASLVCAHDADAPTTACVKPPPTNTIGNAQAVTP